MKNFIVVYIISLFVLSFNLHAELNSTMFDVRHIGYNEGLSSERVFSIIQDKDNVIWIATKIGIDRYNGQVVKSYDMPGSTNYGDMAGRRLYLIYNKNNGIRAYDNTGRIYHYSNNDDLFYQEYNLGQSLKDIILNSLYIDIDGSSWFGLNRGLYKKDGKSDDIVPVIENCYINNIISADNNLFIGTSTGVLSYNVKSGKTEKLIDNCDVLSLFFDDKSNNLWVGTFNNGVFIINVLSHSVSKIEGVGNIFYKPIRAITKYDENSFLVGIDGGGVYVVDAYSLQTHLFMNTEDKITDSYIVGNGIYTIIKDSQDNIWIGSYTGGVSFAVRMKYPIALIRHEKGNDQSLANNNVNDIEENEPGNVWFATDSGISIYNFNKRSWRHELKDRVAITLCKDNKNNIWVGTYGDGVYLLDGHGVVKKHLTKQGNGLSTNYIFSIKEDYDGDIWIGGLDGSLMRLNKTSMKLHLYDINWVQSIVIMDDNTVAVATVNGFYLVNKRSNEIKHLASSQEYNDINASAYIVTMMKNDDETIWLGTEGGGLNLYDIKKGNIKILTTKDGLPSNDVYSIQRDKNGRIWLSTGKGLAVIENDKVSSLNYMGDIDKEFNKSSFMLLQDGRFAYGSTNGVVLISPDALTETNYQAPLKFTSLVIEYLDEAERNKMRPKIWNMLCKGIVELNYSENSFEINFEAINYRYQRDIVYQYFLEGYEKSWSDITSNGTVRYTNVSPGSYKLIVRSLRRSDGFIISEKNLSIVVNQPWWNSWCAWIIYLLIIGSIVYFFFLFNYNRMQKRYDEDKIRFFINTAHDIRTPVTLIMSPLEDLCKVGGFSENISYLLNLARNNTHKLYELITTLLEFEKVDTFRQHLKLESVNVNDLLSEEVAGFQAICDKKQLNLSLLLPDNEIYAKLDRHMLEIIMDNIISNACKYTESNGKISVSLTYNYKKIFICIKDTGVGIPKKDQNRIFKGVFRGDNVRNLKESGTGFGLLQVNRAVRLLHGNIKFESEENSGTEFTLTFKRTFEEPVTSSSEKRREIKNLEDVNELPLKVSTHVSEELNTILIVEDNDALRYYLRKTFEYEYNVIDASDAEKALEYLKDGYPDVILSDVMMPGIQGDELCHIVKQNPETSSIPFVLLTAKVNHESMVEGLKKGADDYIPKPFNTEILKLKICGLIENRKRLWKYYMKQILGQVEVTNKEDLSIEENKKNEDSDEIEEQALSEDDHSFLMHATDIVIQNISDTEFSINKLCMEMAMSRTLFYGRLKSLTGKAPQEFIRIIRLQKAAELLKKGVSVTEVAESTGFINTKYFSSLFKKQFGVQPSKYEKDNM